MRNKWEIAGAAAAIILGIGVISAMSVNTAKSYNTVFSIGGRVELRNTIEIPLSETDSLEVLYTSKNLKIYPGEGENIVIKEYLQSGREKAFAEVTRDGRKAVVTGGRDQVITIFGFFTGMERIEVYVPKEGLKELRIQTGSGNITAESGFTLDTDTLQVKAGSGNVKWKDTRAKDYEVQTSSGNIGLKDMEGNGTVGAGSGNIRAEEIKGCLTAGTGSGNITIEEFSGWGSMEAGSGNIKVEALEVTGDVKASARSGNVHIDLPGGLSFETRLQTGSGSIRSSFKESLSYNEKGNRAEGKIGDEPVCVIEAETTSGNINITAG